MTSSSNSNLSNCEKTTAKLHKYSLAVLFTTIQILVILNSIT